FFRLRRLPAMSTLVPYTTLFRSGALHRDKHKQFAQHEWEQFCEIGFPGMTIGEKYGGTPLDSISESIVIEELSRCDASFGVLMADRKSTRLNSSHVKISYAVFCL